MVHATLAVLLALASGAPPTDGDGQAIRLPRDPAISPDGKSIAFAWQGDIWTAPIEGGESTRLTIHAADDSSPLFGPKGERLYFTSGRSGAQQIYWMPVDGGAAVQVTHDTNRKSLLDVSADGKQLLISQSTTRGWHYSESSRLFLLSADGEGPKRMLFDAGTSDAALSPDGTKVLFVRGRSAWNRKGYEGPQAAQLWLADLSESPATLTRLDEDRPDFQNVAAMDPMWSEDGASYYYTSDPDGVFDIYHRALGAGPETARRVTNVRKIDESDDGVAFPVLSRDGDTLLVRRRFGLLSVDPKSGVTRSIELMASGDQVASATERNLVTRADRIAFTPDGKQMAFVAGGDVWVMDRVLKEPVRITETEHEETSLVFDEAGERLFFVTDSGGEVDIWEATHDRDDGIWWLADSFALRQVTNDRAVEEDLHRSPNGTHIAFVKGTDLFVMDVDGTDHRRVAAMWSSPSFDWSPDGRWLTYATQDDDYNSDIFVVPLDGTREPFNISRHPDRDSSPKWSGDGNRIAWVGRRDGEEADIYWVELNKAAAEETGRDATLEKALEAMKKGGNKKKPKGGKPNKDAALEGEQPGAKPDDEAGDEAGEELKNNEDSKVTIDFDGLLDRIERLRYPDTFESNLIWAGDKGSRLCFTAEINGEFAFWGVDFPRPTERGEARRSRQEKIAGSALSGAEWLGASKQFVGLSSGAPASMSASGKIETFGFEVRASTDWREVRKIAFDQGWRAMRDVYYDEAYNNKDWYAIRAKYRPMAAECVGAAEFSELMNMMLGELNASHMGHRGGRDPLPSADDQNEWAPRTYHLGLRFEHGAEGPGLVVESVIPGSPCDLARSHVATGERLLSIDGVNVGPDVDVERLLTMDAPRDVALKVRSAAGEDRDVSVRPAASVTELLYDEWVDKTRAEVEELSDGKLGYLHIRGMNFPSFRQMEEDLYHAGHGKDGLIIDVRFNGGGSTTDHVLTALTQPVHAITQSRGSGEGYPQDRKIYASWTKPIVLMCNEHSFSNAEILSHAIQQIGRGKLVGMRTAGGVISTGSVRLMDGGSVRMPGRGWYLASTGEDMELNGCKPDICFWNDPRWQWQRSDAQLTSAVEELQREVAAEAAREKVKPVPASVLRK